MLLFSFGDFDICIMDFSIPHTRWLLFLRSYRKVYFAAQILIAFDMKISIRVKI